MKGHGLLCVKSIMTIVLSIGLVYLTITNPETFGDTFKSCVTMVVTFYFTHQVNKSSESLSRNENVDLNTHQINKTTEQKQQESEANDNVNNERD